MKNLEIEKELNRYYIEKAREARIHLISRYDVEFKTHEYEDKLKKEKKISYDSFNLYPAYKKLGIQVLGLTLKIDNAKVIETFFDGKKRLSKKRIAQCLERELLSVACKTLAKTPLHVFWILEPHKSGVPHLHAMLFFPNKNNFFDKLNTTLAKHFGEKSVSKNPNLEYLLREKNTIKQPTQKNKSNLT